MSYSITSQQFATKIKSISLSTSKMRDDVQDALVGATYLCIKNSAGTTPFQQILDAVGGTAHRVGITTWIETFAPCRMQSGKVLKHKDNWAKLDKEGALADFDAFMADMGANEDGKRWYQIAKAQNTTESIFKPDSRVESLLAALNKHDCTVLAKYLREAFDNYKSATV